MVSMIPYLAYGASVIPVTAPRFRGGQKPAEDRRLCDDPVISQQFLNAGITDYTTLFQRAMATTPQWGYTRAFYNVPNTPYLLGFPLKDIDRFRPIEQYIPTGPFQGVNNPYPSFELGQCVARNPDGLVLHHRLDGIPAGIVYESKVPLKPEIRYALIKNYRYSAHDWERYNDHLKRMARMPQRAYDELANLIARMLKSGIYFDPSPNNILVDPKAKVFHVIDPTTYDKALKYQNECNHLAGMVGALMDSSYVFNQSAQAVPQGSRSDSYPQFVQIRKDILYKSLLAGYKAQLDPTINPYKEFIREDNKDIKNDFYEPYDLRHAFKIAGIPIADNELVRILDLYDRKDGGAFSLRLRELFGK